MEYRRVWKTLKFNSKNRDSNPVICESRIKCTKMSTLTINGPKATEIPFRCLVISERFQRKPIEIIVWIFFDHQFESAYVSRILLEKSSQRILDGLRLSRFHDFDRIVPNLRRRNVQTPNQDRGRLLARQLCQNF